MSAIESRNIQCIYDDYITSLDQSGTSVDITLAGGSKKTHDMVVAADGSTSKTRSFILSQDVLKNSYRFLGQYMAFSSIPSRSTDPQMWQWYNTAKGLGLFLRPHRAASTMGAYLCITMPKRGKRDPIVRNAMNSGTAETKQMLHDYFRDAGWEAKRILQGLPTSEDFYMSGMTQTKTSTWTNGRAVGFGTSLAIESAYVLAGELSKIDGASDVPDALRRYEAVFRPFYTKVGDIPPPGLPQLPFPQSAWGVWLLGCGLWLLATTRVYKLFRTGKRRFPVYDWVSA